MKITSTMLHTYTYTIYDYYCIYVRQVDIPKFKPTLSLN